MFHCIEATVAPLIICGCAHTLIATYVYLKDTGMYKHTQPLGVRSFSSREGDGNVMQMGFCGENFRRQREEREREREGGREERGILGGVEAGRISLLRHLPLRDRPRARIIFTEIKSKIRLALKCALDRARPNRRWLSKRRRRSYPEARRRLVRSDREDPTRTRGYTRGGKQRKTDRGRQRKLQGV